MPHRSRSAESFLAGLPGSLAPLLADLAACTRDIDLAWTAVEFAGRMLDLDDCVVYLLDPGSATLAQYAAWGPKRIAERVVENRIKLRIGEGVVGACALSGDSIIVSDTRLDRRHVADDGSGLSELAVPVLVGARVLGVIDTEHPTPDHFGSRHVRALQAIAAPLAQGLLRVGR
jgi:putative methionine-R-sulfoxide reductase with GAF domain